MAKILIDLSQMSIDATRAAVFKSKTFPDTDVLRTVIVNSLLFYRNKLRSPSDEVILCLDNKDRRYWRRELFPYYKRNREKGRKEDTSFDWKSFFKSFDEIKAEFREFLPYKTLDVPGAEADDLIAILTLVYGPVERISILSSDKDFLQLHAFSPNNIRQWSTIHKGFINTKTQNYNLFQHIVKGDGGDGIPNILSDDDTFVNPDKRQKSIYAKHLAVWESEGGIANPEKFCNSVDMLNRFTRNRTLIDLTQIPGPIAESIKNTYLNLSPGNNFFSYLVKHQLHSAISRGDF